MKSISAIVVALSVLQGSATALANEENGGAIQYSYAEAGIAAPFGSGDPTLSLRGSFDIGRGIYVIGSYARQEIGRSSYQWIEAGGGYHLKFPWAEVPGQLDAIASVSLAHDSVDYNSRSGCCDTSSSDVGLAVRAGARWLVPSEWTAGRQLEATAYAQIRSSDIVGRFSLHSEARYHFTDQMSVGVGLNSGDVGDGARISLRFAF